MTHLLKTATGLALACAALGAAHPASALTYDATADFSTASDPSTLDGGVWSYGFENVLGLNFALDASNSPATLAFSSNVQGWAASTIGYPYVAKNITTAPISYINVTVQPGQIVMHPGSAGQYSVVRFTAPAAGTYALATAFTGLDSTPTTTDVHVLLDGTSLFSGTVGSYETPVPYTSALHLASGDTVDFAVGYGANGTYLNDSTGFSATLTANAAAVPEAPAGALLLLSLLPLGLLIARRSRSTNS